MGTLLKTVDYSASIDWVAIKALPSDVEPPPDARRIRAGGREWLATSEGAFLVEGGHLIRMTVPFYNVRDIVHVAGITWILTGKEGLMVEPGPTYQVSSYLTVPVPEKIGQVNRILGYRDKAYLGTDTGVYRLDGNSYQRIGGIDRAVHDLRTLGETLWAVTTQGFNFGPVYRIEELEATPFPDEETPVQALFGVVDTVWIHVGNLTTDGPVYRIEENAAIPILDQDTVVRQVRVMQDNAWLLTAEDGGWGPAYRWDGMTATPVPDADAQVRAL